MDGWYLEMVHSLFQCFYILVLFLLFRVQSRFCYVLCVLEDGFGGGRLVVLGLFQCLHF